MDRQYFQQQDPFGDTLIWFEENGRRVSFSEAPGNRHYEEYLVWVAEGNTAEAIEEA